MVGFIMAFLIGVAVIIGVNIAVIEVIRKQREEKERG